MVLVPGLVDFSFLSQNVLVMQVDWGSADYAGIVQVIIEPILKPDHQYFLWRIHVAGQVSEFLDVFGHRLVSLPYVPHAISGLLVS